MVPADLITCHETPPSQPPSPRLGRSSQADLDARMAACDEVRTHRGRWCIGKTPMQAFLDNHPIARENRTSTRSPDSFDPADTRHPGTTPSDQGHISACGHLPAPHCCRGIGRGIRSAHEVCSNGPGTLAAASSAWAAPGIDGHGQRTMAEKIPRCCTCPRRAGPGSPSPRLGGRSRHRNGTSCRPSLASGADP